MVNLNLPTFPFELKQDHDQILIFDFLRKRYVVLTPEEWVRQHFTNYIITHLNYPRSLVKVEGGLRFNKLQKRSDIVVFNREGNPWMVIECKAPDLKLSDRTVHQASVYNHSLKAKYLVITNGLTHICCEIDWANSKTIILQTMPQYL